jgi:5'-nucleotidase/UDP-sugar diphosphatase
MKRAIAAGLRPGLFLSALLGIFTLSACASVPPAAQPAETRIVIFHTNDIHGKIDNFAKVAAIIDAERKGGAEVFFFCAGDNFTGNPVIDQYDPPVSRQP